MANNNNTLYEDFVEKFKPKLTTDDCYTPEPIYNAVVDWCKSVLPLEGREIVRPFYPNGDFESFNYPPNCIVIDNPPFSILSKIRRFYIAHKIDYFLFAPHLTCFSSNIPDTKIITGESIVYHNGAVVNTAYVSNCFGDVEIMTDPRLTWTIINNNIRGKQLAKYEYPTNVITSTRCEDWCRHTALQIPRDKVRRISELDEQKRLKKGIFGGGYLVGDEVVELINKAKNNEHLSHNYDTRPPQAKQVWQLSEREKNIIKDINNGVREPKQLSLFD